MTVRTAQGLHVGAVVAYAVAVLVVVLSLPDRVPLHWGPSGSADSYGSRTTYLLVLVTIGLLLVGVFALCVRTARRGSLTWMNVPHKDWWSRTPARESELRDRLVVDLHAFGTATFLLLVGVVVLTGRAARDDTDLGASMWVLVGAYVAVVLGGAVWAARVRYRPAPTIDG